MRNSKGQFILGVHSHPETEFKKGQHWRTKKPYWNKEWLYNEYINKKRSSSEIAKDEGITDGGILFWLKKHGIKTRSTSEVRRIKFWGQPGEKNPMFGKRGPEVGNWQGGRTPERQAFYSSQEYIIASKTVWKRDHGICQRCGAYNIKMDIHHIISFSEKKYRADITNLVVLCRQCHRFVHSKKNKESEFIKRSVLPNKKVQT